MRKIAFRSSFLLIAMTPGIMSKASAQTNATQGMPNMSNDGQAQVDHSMPAHHMDTGSHITGSHMKMTALRPVKPGDQEKAEQVALAARKVCGRYKDYKAALADGFHIFMPNVPLKEYHFNNPEYAREAAEHFNPEHPTSLLYEKNGDGYKLIGVMYTAPKWTSEDELNPATLSSTMFCETSSRRNWIALLPLRWSMKSI
ncbi:MAG: hypothetical protein LAP86_27215 [Acidobacteriia bacterium]|nr:hypothetical protein [Terriglobia bacterium]